MKLLLVGGPSSTGKTTIIQRIIEKRQNKYKIAYLKVHYPKEFMCELLNNYIGVSNKTKNIINECKLLNISITKPFINKCNSKYEVIDGKLVYPLSLIKKIGTLTSNQIINERNENAYHAQWHYV
jgi:DNA polymerase-3 subunit alpha